VEEFKSIFEGLDVAYGQHQSEGKRADGKQEGRSYIVKKLVTDDLWQAHLDGEGPSLGIIPIMADNTSRWGCIDIDTYPIDYRKIINSQLELYNYLWCLVAPKVVDYIFSCFLKNQSPQN
jgi:hypothetical protein